MSCAMDIVSIEFIHEQNENMVLFPVLSELASTDRYQKEWVRWNGSGGVADRWTG